MTRTLFDGPEREGARSRRAPSPLAERLRPAGLDEVVGQEQVAGPEGFLRRAIAEDRVPSLIFWGPPGSGKTTLARIIAAETDALYVPFSAVTAGIKEVKGVMRDAARLRRAEGRRTLLFVDEIHRFNRAQQDAFLPFVESGDIILIGATTENPSFELNSALLSRCRVVVLAALSEEELRVLVDRALSDADRGLAERGVEVDEPARETIVRLATGDARRALSLLEMAVEDAAGRGAAAVGAADVESLAQRRVPLYDKSGEEHFNLISALHKSLRESDADAALYWLARMLDAGEDPLYLARRMVRFASEDVGLADPQALPQAVAGWEAYRRLGSPEGELALAQTAIYLALAPKSNAAYAALARARRAAEEHPAEPVPPALRNAPTRLMRNLGYGRGYVYAHDAEGGVGGLECRPEAARGERYYRPTGRGFEAELERRLKRFEALRKRARSGQPNKKAT